MAIADFPGRSRLDACPGALQTHAAADGGLARVRVPGGRLTPFCLRELAEAASSYGSGVIELTSRANVQVRGLGPSDGPSDGTSDGAGNGFATRMAAAGLLPSATHERVRNVLASPLSGLDGAGVADVTPLVDELDRRLCARPALAALPGRFMFALDDGRGDVAGLGADAAVLPTGVDEAALLVAGVDTGIRVPLGEAVTALLAAADAFLAEQAAQGVTAWRISELRDGAARVTARVRAALVPRAGVPASSAADDGPSRYGTAGPGPGTGSGPGGGPVGTGSEPGTGTGPEIGPVRAEPVTLGPVGVFPSRDGTRVALGVAVPLGRLTAAQAEALADAAVGGEIRLTPWRGAVLPGLPPDEVAATAARLTAAGLVADPASPWIGVTACAGRPGCAKSLADVRADAALVVARAGGAVAGGAPGTGTLPVHWAGCGRRCGRPRGRVADVVATGDGYRVELDGTGLTCAGIEETAAALAAARGDL
ncbi:precorrin-3B synthase [Streptosporangium becharense]|uniref:Precorrin-3B synthase n=1 Tax=Streptosporangium becharense TaxID=1816182 RepID=A0A7W9IMX1_9ACTN|nr:precorrin-3B synthase [Streptosporangium becharense]MBB2914452.1 precorrin-3B synthase [Streptosporangium becharense]MBB5823516.1 precorrin-3B synthase [Streptosporangium becharense]